MSTDIFQYITTQEKAFETEEVQLGDNWSWSFRKHVQLIFHLKNGIFFTGENNWLRAFKNIMEPILNLSYWSEDIELKDVVFSIEDKGDRALSFLVKKYHDEIFVKKYNLDTMFDEITESDLDYGGALVQKSDNPKPETLALNKIAFCDQTDIEGGPIGFKFNFSPDKLRAMGKNGWGKESNGANATLEDIILLAQPEKNLLGTNAKKTEVTGKNIEVYVVRGELPEAYLKDNDNMSDWYGQVQIVAFYHGKEGQRNGVVLYRKKETESSLKFHTSKKVEGRALGRGVGETLLHPQIWTNFLTIHKTNMLESASKTPLYTDDENYTNKNKIQDMENLEITSIETGKKIYQVPTASPVNVQLFEKSINEWYEHAQYAGSAFDPMMGKEAVSGTTFRGQDQVVQQGKGIHDRRRGQRAKFIEEIYRDWIIPEISKEINNGTKFLATLTSEEMKWVSESLATRYASKEYVSDVLSGRQPRDPEALKQACIAEFSKKGNKHFFEILKNEFEDVSIKMDINIAGKQKNLAGMSDKLLSIFQVAFANPEGFKQTMQIPGMAASFNDILEFSGISQVDFAGMMNMSTTQAAPPGGTSAALPPPGAPVPSPVAAAPQPAYA